MAPSSEIYIDATETDPGVRARAEVHDVHERLRAELAGFTEPAKDGSSGAPVDAALVAFCTGELRRYLAAADQTLYAAASGAAETRLLVRALRGGSAALDARIGALAAFPDAAAAVEAARAVEAVLAVHLAAEETVLLPALAAMPGADLPTLVADLRTLLDGGSLDAPEVIDVREIRHGQRHPRIFARYARLAPGESFTLVNNHDPKPLRREFEATHPGAHTWDYVESGPEVWRVRIGKASTDA
ncbi:DUF2249 domain-containing protein [Streptomyces sp. NRRL F-5126]|uniref:DUF2249 domain-containing protein n=1 Tax=Streptomyces sp. NRRL F-5126 TaxID=1463857 RepID=UPI0004C689FB|nr:DUF2249 domain-containing protein [Streptomyces sp. NRRL F-5126]